MHLADGYYRASGRPLATFTSIGPGTINTTVGVATCYVDSTAVLVITSDTHMFGRGVLQEIEKRHGSNFPQILEPIVKRYWQVNQIGQLPLVIQRAFNYMLTGRPGPVLIDLPMDVQSDAVNDKIDLNLEVTNLTNILDVLGFLAALTAHIPAKTKKRITSSFVYFNRALVILQGLFSKLVTVYFSKSRAYTTKYTDKIKVDTQKEGDLTIDKVQTPVGMIKERLRYGLETFSTAVTEYFVKTVNDLKVLNFWIENTYFEADYKGYDRRIGGGGVNIAIATRSPFARLYVEYIGLVNLAYLMADAPGEVEKTLELLKRQDDALYEILAGSSSEIIGFPDNLTSEGLGERWFRKYYMPYYDFVQSN